MNLYENNRVHILKFDLDRVYLLIITSHVPELTLRGLMHVWGWGWMKMVSLVALYAHIFRDPPNVTHPSRAWPYSPHETQFKVSQNCTYGHRNLL